jgi:localization factor PodJL
VRNRRRAYRDQVDDEDEDLASVHDRLDDLTRQLERMAQAGFAQAAPAPAPAFSTAPPPPRERAPAADPRAQDRVADALARLDRRLDQVITEGRQAAQDFARQDFARQDFGRPQARYASPRQAAPPQQPAPAPAQKRGPASWAEQISARQRALDGVAAQAAPAAAPAFAPAAPEPAAWNAAHDLAGVQQQLYEINHQISSLHHPYENAINALRQDLAEIGRALTEAMPRRAIETLETEVRALSERVGQSRQAGAEGQSLAVVEQELAEVRDALRHLTPAESLVGFEDAVRGLSQKIDMIAETAQAPGGDPRAFKQLEQAVTSLRGVVSNVASDGALAQLSAEVHGLAAQFERAAAESSSEALTRLESRVAALMESGRVVPPELEASIRELSERLDRAQLSQGDQLALGALEDRIAKLSEKLEASNARLSQLDAVERGLADLLVHLEETKAGSRTLRATPPAEPQPEPAVPHRPAPAAPAQAPVHTPAPATAESPLDLIPEMVTAEAPTAPQYAQEAPSTELAPLAPRAAPLAEAEYMPPAAPQPRPRGRGMPGGPARQPIDPNLPPDTPLEPGSGVPRVRPGSAAARIAASEAALSGFKHSAADPASKSAAIAAARNAAKSAYLDTPVKAPKQPREKSRGFWPFKKNKAAGEPQLSAPVPVSVPMPAPAPASMPPPMAASQMPGSPIPASHVPDAPLPRGQRVRLFLKKVLIATCVAIIVAGTAMTAMDYLFTDIPPLPNVENLGNSDAPRSDAPKSTPGNAPRTTPVPSRPMPGPQGSLIVPQGADPEATGQIGNMTSFFDPSTVIAPKQQNPDVTGSIARKTPPAQAPAAAKAPEAIAPTGKPHIDALPASISPALRHALAASDPAAEYELGIRYAEGRGLPQSTAEAARWLERAAHAGFAPAQFRFAGLNEKGDGLKKDVQTARKLYLAAAGKGHAKAMHNLAVLYAEGVDGKPDYKAAAQWFQKASNYGVTDSQYNLAILYARGIGLTANLAESYRWFALAAAAGDGEAAKKRDEVAARLDQKTLAMAKAAAQGFAPDREPDEAINLKAPPGGWDKAPAAQAKAKR